ncbi:signal peptidase I [bacterium]|nr:MAG: signal peptidase I [bacterium]
MGVREFIDALARTPQSTIFLFALGLTVLRLVVYPLLRRTAAHKRGPGYKFGRGLNEIADSLVYAAILIFFLVRPFVFQTFVIPSGSMVPTLLVNDYIGLNKAIYRYTEPQRHDIVVFRPPKRAVLDTQVDGAGNVNVDFVKRLIGLPGDLIEIRRGELYQNGQRVDQPWIHYTRPLGDGTKFEDLEPDVVKEMTKQNWKLVMRNGEVYPLNYTDYDANSEYPQRGPDGILPYGTVPDYALTDEAEMKRLEAEPPQKIPEGYYLFMGDNRNNSSDGRAWGLVPKASIVGRAEFIWMPLSRAQGLRGK